MSEDRNREASDAYCPECKSYIVSERVTLEECCDTCGTKVEWHGHFDRPTESALRAELAALKIRHRDDLRDLEKFRTKYQYAAAKLEAAHGRAMIYAEREDALQARVEELEGERDKAISISFDTLKANAEMLKEKAELREEVVELRLMLAVAYSGSSKLYLDDGEMQDNSTLPVIDYKRDTPFVIRGKLSKRALALEAE